MADDRIPRYDKRIVAYMDNDLPLDVDGETYHSALACPPVITAPTFAKRFDYIEQQRIWQDVLEVCGNATDLVFLFLTVFDSMSPERNYLQWEFGSDDDTLATEISRKLGRALAASG